jgi:hypothetical protein
MKKMTVSSFLYFFFISSVFSQNGEYVGGASFTKRIEYNLLMLDGVYNLRIKGDVEKLFFGDFNAPVEFFYKPSFSGASGFKSRRQRTVPAPESRANVEPINKTQPRQDSLSEQRIPKDLLPP